MLENHIFLIWDLRLNDQIHNIYFHFLLFNIISFFAFSHSLIGSFPFFFVFFRGQGQGFGEGVEDKGPGDGRGEVVGGGSDEEDEAVGGGGEKLCDG